MKKFLVFTGWVLLFGTTAFGQLSVGVRSGVLWSNINQSQLLDEVTPTFNDLISNTSAVVLEQSLGENFAIESGLGYTRKGFAFNAGTNVDLFNIPLPLGVEARAQFDYLEVPILFKAKAGTGPVRFYALAGPHLGYALSGRLANRSTGLIRLDLPSTNIDLDALNYQRLEVGATAGAGVEITTSFGKFFADGRYHQGLTNNADIPLVTESFRNRGISAQVGFLLPL